MKNTQIAAQAATARTRGIMGTGSDLNVYIPGRTNSTDVAGLGAGAGKTPSFNAPRSPGLDETDVTSPNPESPVPTTANPTTVKDSGYSLSFLQGRPTWQLVAGGAALVIVVALVLA